MIRMSLLSQVLICKAYHQTQCSQPSSLPKDSMTPFRKRIIEDPSLPIVSCQGSVEDSYTHTHTRDCSPGHAGKEGPQLARTGAEELMLLNCGVGEDS